MCSARARAATKWRQRSRGCSDPLDNDRSGPLSVCGRGLGLTNPHEIPTRLAPFQEWRRSLTPSFPLSRLRERVGERASLARADARDPLANLGEAVLLRGYRAPRSQGLASP